MTAIDHDRANASRGGLRRVIGAAVAIALIAALAHDVAVSPARSFGARAALTAIDSYRAHVSPHLRGIVTCRFSPTCSAYGRESIRKYGLAVGGWRTVKRIARCNAWTPAGTVDPP